jgi:anti-sigma factor RsiW
VTCKELVEGLDAYFAGELPPNRRSGLEEHAHGCPACRRYLESYRATIDLARQGSERDARSEGVEGFERLVRRIVGARRRRGR